MSHSVKGCLSKGRRREKNAGKGREKIAEERLDEKNRENADETAYSLIFYDLCCAKGGDTVCQCGELRQTQCLSADTLVPAEAL